MVSTSPSPTQSRNPEPRVLKDLLIGILAGPTATGKTQIALDFARAQGNIEIINADSLQVYCGVDIGSAKISPTLRNEIPHHLLDILPPDERFTAGDFIRAVKKAVQDIEARGKRVLIVGGTGFYLKALLYGMWPTGRTDVELRKKLETFNLEKLYSEVYALDPSAAKRIGPEDRYRLVRALEAMTVTGKPLTELEKTVSLNASPRFKLWVLDREDSDLQNRLQTRISEMLLSGWIEEVQTLQKKFPRSPVLKAVGYRQVENYLAGALPPGRKIDPGLEGLKSEIFLAHRQLVRNQRKWFRSEKARKDFLLDRDQEKLKDALQQTYSLDSL